jgi:hypothetical protein
MLQTSMFAELTPIIGVNVTIAPARAAAARGPSAAALRVPLNAPLKFA